MVLIYDGDGCDGCFTMLPSSATCRFGVGFLYLIVLCVVYFVYMSKPVSLHGQIKLCVRVLQVKPLGVIWGKYREFYNKKNTIMFDDIDRKSVV